MTAPALKIPDGYGSYRDASFEPQIDPEVKEEIKGADETLKQSLRRRACEDRYFLAAGVLGYQDVNPYTHGPLIRGLEDKSLKRRMFLMHRGSLKSTLGTVTDSVGESLTDADHYRGLIVNEVEENAVGFLSEIKAHFENNELIHELFPERIPSRFGGPGSKWSTTKACLPRSTSYKEWTWRAVGVGTAIVSQHFTRIKCDDLIGFDASHSAAAMKFAISYAKSMEPLLVNMDEDIIDFIGTRWAINDLYKEMLRVYGDDMSYFAREDIEVVPQEISDDVLIEAGFKVEELEHVRGTRQPIFRRKFSLHRLKRLEEIDPVLYYAQFKNNPIADGIKDFDSTKVKYFDFDSAGNLVFRDRNGQISRWPRQALDIVMACDPNAGELTSPDLPAIGVFAFSPNDEQFCLDMWSRRVQPDTFVEKMFEMWEQWSPRVCGIEKAGMSTAAFWMKKLARDRGTYINYEPLTHKNRNKQERIRKAIVGTINAGNFYIRRHQTSLMHQIRFHPDLDNDDEIDTAAYATELTVRPMTQKQYSAEKRAVEHILASRNQITGY